MVFVTYLMTNLYIFYDLIPNFFFWNMYIGICLFLYNNLLLWTATLVLLAKNPIHAILFLVFLFILTGIWFILLNSEFLAFLIFIVYVGAISVLFLFILMMLSIRLKNLKENIIKYIPISLWVFYVLIYISLNSFYKSYSTEQESFVEYHLINYYYNDFMVKPIASTNVHVIGLLLYTFFYYLFIMSSIVLLIAMLGAISLTLNAKTLLKTQKIYKQNIKNYYNSFLLKQNIKKNYYNFLYFDIKDNYYNPFYSFLRQKIKNFNYWLLKNHLNTYYNALLLNEKSNKYDINLVLFYVYFHNKRESRFNYKICVTRE